MRNSSFKLERVHVYMHLCAHLLPDVSVIVNHFDMIGFNASTKAEWDVIRPAGLTLTYKQGMSVPEDFYDTDITLKMKPIEIIIGFEEIEMLIEYSTNLLTVINKQESKPKPKEIKAEAKVVKKKVQETVPQPEPLTTKSNMKINTEIDGLKIKAINDKVKDKYPLAMMWISDLRFKMLQDTIKDIGTSRDIDFGMATFQCELDQETEFSNEYAFM